MRPLPFSALVLVCVGSGENSWQIRGRVDLCFFFWVGVKLSKEAGPNFDL